MLDNDLTTNTDDTTIDDAIVEDLEPTDADDVTGGCCGEPVDYKIKRVTDDAIGTSVSARL